MHGLRALDFFPCLWYVNAASFEFRQNSVLRKQGIISDKKYFFAHFSEQRYEPWRRGMHAAHMPNHSCNQTFQDNLVRQI